MRAGLHALTRAYLARQYAVLFYSLLLTLGAAPVLAALHVDARVLQLFLALNLLATAVGARVRPFASLFPLLVVAVLAMRLAAGLLHADALATATLAAWTAVGLLAASTTVRFAMRATAVGAEHLYAALSAYLLAGFFFGLL
jgi:hypothetical protein